MARPTKYTKALGDKICARLAGGESLRAICRDDGIPSLSTVLLWVVDGKHEQFSVQYRVAREAAGYAHADRIIESVDKVEREEIDAATARAMMDGLKWAAERMAPKAHGPKQAIDHTSSDGSMTPKPTTIELVAPSVDSED